MNRSPTQPPVAPPGGESLELHPVLPRPVELGAGPSPHPAPPPSHSSPLTLKQSIALAALGVAAFHLAYASSAFAFLIVGYLDCLFQLGRQATPRRAFWAGAVVGVAIYAPQLGFFWRLFGPPAMALWMVLAFWIGLFVLSIRLARQSWGGIGAALLAPVLWTGLEYFRSELYYLRFSWLNAGYAFSDSPQLPALMELGTYGVGFVLMSAAALISLFSPRTAWIAGSLLVAGLAVGINYPSDPHPIQPAKGLPLAGVQLEFPGVLEIPGQLDRVLRASPEARIVVLSEYTLDDPVPERLKAWCRKRGRYLILGGKDPVGAGQFYNTVFVVSPQGEVVFRQVKAVPIQFFKDGLPAPRQALWESPWGKIGICVCYDLSYTRVADRLIRLGARALIVPTMDVEEWGAHEHALHARIAPVRAAEYGIPIFRVCSSGVSQSVDARGRVVAAAGFPGQEAILSGTLDLAGRPSLPWDRGLAPACVALIGLLAAGAIIKNRSRSREYGRTGPNCSGDGRRAGD